MEKKEEAEAEEGEEGEREEEGEEEEEEEEPNPVPQDFPLAKLFADSGKAQNLEFRLAFKRSGEGKKDSYRWFWDGAVYFFRGERNGMPPRALKIPQRSTPY